MQEENRPLLPQSLPTCAQISNTDISAIFEDEEEITHNKYLLHNVYYLPGMVQLKRQPGNMIFLSVRKYIHALSPWMTNDPGVKTPFPRGTVAFTFSKKLMPGVLTVNSSKTNCNPGPTWSSSLLFSIPKASGSKSNRISLTPGKYNRYSTRIRSAYSCG